VILGSAQANPAQKMLVKSKPEVNVTNLLTHIVNVAAVIILCHSFSPPKYCPTLQVNKARNYTQLVHFMFFTAFPQDQLKSNGAKAAN